MASEKTAIEIAKEKWSRIAQDIRNIYKKDGEEELAILYKEHKPDLLFRSDDSPDVRQRIAAFLADLNIARNELAEAAAHRARAESKRLTGVRPIVRPAVASVAKSADESDGEDRGPKDPPGTIKGNYMGFSYKIVPRDDGKYWIVRVRRREIAPVRGAPSPYESPVLKTAYKRASDAEVAFRRSIQEILHWYDDHNARIIFLPPIRERMKVGRLRRTPAQSAEHYKDISDKEREEKKKKRKYILEKRKFMKESASSHVPRGPSGTEQPSRTYFYPDKKRRQNPSRLLSLFKQSDTSAGKAAIEYYRRYESKYDLFEKSVDNNKPDYKLLMDSYDLISLSRGNFALDDNEKMASATFSIQKKLKNDIIENLNMCQEIIRAGSTQLGPSRNPSKNPTGPEHLIIARDWLEKAEESWKKYRDSANVASLIATLKNAEISREEFKDAGDKNARSTELCKLAKLEIQKRIKGA